MQHVHEVVWNKVLSMLNIKIIDNTNSKHLGLYTVLGEYDNTEFPLSYCLLSTVAATEISKRTKPLTAWVTTLCNKYGVISQFVHVDKDMAEFGSYWKTWLQAKIQLCWWHLQKAVRTHLQLAKLSTTPYNVECTQGEYGFISAGFQPSGNVTWHFHHASLPSFAVLTNPDHSRFRPLTPDPDLNICGLRRIFC